MKDTYNTLAKPIGKILLKEKNSKFYGYAFPIVSESDAKKHLDLVKKEHYAARHWCYAWQLGTDAGTLHYRVNDDGEPANSAGMPIYGQIQAFDVTNLLIIIVRYFGGIKLGVGGLIQAYKNTTVLTLEAATIIERILTTEFVLSFEYPKMNTVMRIIKERQLTILDQELTLDCKVTIAVRRKDAMTIEKLFQNTFGIKIYDKEKRSPE